jgi:hypothetical protein
VTSGKIIFCEGKSQSLDYQLLDRILSDLIPKGLITVVPAGSKFTFPIFAQGYFASNTNNAERPEFIVFRDRDFDAEPTGDIKLLKRDSMFLSYRACIENYLLDANLIHAYWEEKCQENIEYPSLRKWGHGNSPGIETISTWIEESAKDLKDYQSVRWALGDLASLSEAREHLKTTWMKNSGHLPEQLELQYCHEKAIELISQFRQSVDQITGEHFEEGLKKYQELFSQQEFWQQKQYMVWFHGKDMQKAMQKRKMSYISLKDFNEWATKHVDITQHQDLLELQERVKELEISH